MRAWPDAFSLGAIAVDPSKGKDARRGDYSAIVFVGLSGANIFVDSSISRRPVEQIINDGIDMAETYASSLHGFGVEVNAFQELLVGEFERQVEARQLNPLPIHTMTNSVNKKLRIGRLGPYFARRKFIFRPTPSNRLLVDQCKTFSMAETSGVHDDGPDGLEMAVRLLNHLAGIEVADDGLGFTDFLV